MSFFKLFTLFLFTSASFTLFADESSAIDNQVWRPFMQAFSENNAQLMNSLHSDDVIRVVIDANRVFIGQAYKDKNNEVFEKWEQKGLDQTLQISILSRTISGDVAFDTGTFKQTRTKGDKTSSSYGSFFVTLKKVDGRWKIATDADTGRFQPDEKTFRQGRIISDG